MMCGRVKRQAVNADRTDIRDRIDAALEKMAWREMEVRAIYLTEADRTALGKIMRRELGVRGKVHPCGYRDHIVRSGETSKVYSTHGVAVMVPVRLRQRVAA